jgi:hypothetical protein
MLSPEQLHSRKRGIDHPHLNAVMAQVVGSAALGTNSAVEDTSGKCEKGAYTTALADAELERFSDIQNTWRRLCPAPGDFADA